MTETEPGQRFEWDRVPVVVKLPNKAKFPEVYGFAGSTAQVFLEGQFLIPRARSSKTLYVFIHPAATLQLLPLPGALAGAGGHVLCAASRYPKNDSSLIMENVAVDLGEWIRFAREERRYERVILVGWSGGGSLSLFYQAQAESPSVTSTPAGEPVDLAGLPPADAVIFVAAHLSRAEVLTEWMDPSVANELDPDDRLLEFDIYSDDCPNRPPFTSDFVGRFRERQIARNRRITTWCQDMLAQLTKRGGPERERAFVVHRTMCDVRWLDGTIDPNSRRIGWSYLGDPKVANCAPAGLARYSSLRSWLSQWSYDLSNAKGVINAAKIIKTPVLQIENEADDAVPATHNSIVYHALGTTAKEHHRIVGATHYYVGQPDLLHECLQTIFDWVGRRFGET